jgi:type 1 glutamine amidotransferase
MKDKPKSIRFLGGGFCHPVDEQVDRLARWLGDGFEWENRDGRKAFEDLEGVDLFIIAGLHFEGMSNSKRFTPMPYEPMTNEDIGAFRTYVSSGRPVLGFHGGIASYTEFAEFSQLIGFSWIWGVTAHTPVGTWPMQPANVDFSLARHLDAFETRDEIYYNVQVTPGMRDLRVHLMGLYHKMRTPLLLTAEGGRVEGAGKVAYFGLGHEMDSLDAPEVKELFKQTIQWLIQNQTR